jgi:hypothetical protein
MVRQLVSGGVLVLMIAMGVTGSTAAEGDQPVPSVDQFATGQVVAYYFYGNVRCATCRKLEAYSKEAIEGGFGDEIAAGSLEWRAVNVDEPENEHFVTDFELVTRALVLVEYAEGDVTRWQDLKLIWKLVGDKPGYLTYVREATSEFLEEG